MILFLANAYAFQQKQSGVVAGDWENEQHIREMPLSRLHYKNRKCNEYPRILHLKKF